jgi:hypothetical protein
MRIFGILAANLTVVLLIYAPAAGQNAEKSPPEFALMNKAKDIHIISDRDEPLLDCFRRNRMLVGGVVPESLDKIIQAKEPLAKFFVNYASQNDDPRLASTFGAFLEIAPPARSVVKLLQRHRKELGPTLILRRDERKANLYHVVGCTDRTSVGFFDNDKKNPADGFSQKDLCFKGGPTK